MINQEGKPRAMTTNLLNAAPESGAETAAALEIPAKFRDPETGALQADKLLKSYLALEKRMARMVALPGDDADEPARRSFFRALGVPETPDAYQIELRHPQVQLDPAVNARLHQAGFTPAQAQLVYDLACDHVMPQLEQFAGDVAASREREQLEAHFGGPARFRETARALDAWGRANLPPKLFDALAGTAQGVLALHAMMQNREPGLGGNGGGGKAGLPSEAELAKLMRDPRYWKHRDPEILAQVTEGFRRLYPG